MNNTNFIKTLGLIFFAPIFILAQKKDFGTIVHNELLSNILLDTKSISSHKMSEHSIYGISNSFYHFSFSCTMTIAMEHSKPQTRASHYDLYIKTDTNNVYRDSLRLDILHYWERQNEWYQELVKKHNYSANIDSAGWEHLPVDKFVLVKDGDFAMYSINEEGNSVIIWTQGKIIEIICSNKKRISISQFLAKKIAIKSKIGNLDWGQQKEIYPSGVITKLKNRTI